MIKPGGLGRALSILALPPVRRTFNPLYVSRSPRSDLVTEPLCQGYLFIRFDVAREPWLGLRNVPGIAGLICDADGMPKTVPHRIMARLLAHPIVYAPGAEERAGVEVMKAPCDGDKVIVMAGPFASFHGEVKTMTAEDRADLRMCLFGRETVINLPLSSFRAA
jgi:transcription antitermination factor NusG